MKNTNETKETIEQPKLTSVEMSNSLIELSESKYWLAIEMYYNGLRKLAENTILSVDPFKNPTEVARSQGFIQALPYLKIFIEGEKNRRAEKEAGNK